MALANSYMLAELHMISPEQQQEVDVSASIKLFRRLSPRSSPQQPDQNSFPNFTQWASWGSQGWLGELPAIKD